MRGIRKAVIPVAGHGTRFLPLTKVVPKQLFPLGKKPVIQYVVEEAVASGIEEIIFVCHPDKKQTVDYFRTDPGLKRFLAKAKKKREIKTLCGIESMATYRTAYQDRPLGLGHAVWCARQAVAGEPFLVLLPDVIICHPKPASRQLIRQCRDQWGLLVTRVPPSRIEAYGVIEGQKLSDRNYRLKGAVEKPKPHEAPSNLGIVGRYLFPPSIFDHLENAKKGALGEFQLTDAIDALIKSEPGRAILCQGKIFDVGTLEGFAQAWAGFIRGSL